jgi:hypothetical protein
MTTVMTFRTREPVPTECVLNDQMQWSLVFGDELLCDYLQWRTEHVKAFPPPGDFHIPAALQIMWAADGKPGEFDPPFKADDDPPGMIY